MEPAPDYRDALRDVNADIRQALARASDQATYDQARAAIRAGLALLGFEPVDGLPADYKPSVVKRLLAAADKAHDRLGAMG